eukprot:NODE_483_length_803_cov_333.016272_g474_i0.p1 GENE.NODE_483_length_803_cov_333.016272_g474_i0~~NODE_483_length_803_cov_333.016272_g474_i0.p1  ORF type:complete len:196 (-),score=30.99 NODE_483_length_803_cov_333.016272_g474_i0:155-742(-)
MAVNRSRDLVIDASGHLLGRLAATVAKSLIRGQRVTVLRCEKINISGSFVRNKVLLRQWMRKKHLTNPKRGPFHHRAPGAMLERSIRGMIRYRTKKGKAAFSRLNTFEGVPPKWQKRKRFVIPAALTYIKLKPGKPFCELGRLAHESGWQHKDIVEKLEAARKRSSKTYYNEKKKRAALLAKVKREVNAKMPLPF